MPIEYYPGFFKTRDEVLDDIRKQGLWPVAFNYEAVDDAPRHTHDTEVVGYVLEGRTSLTDDATGQRVDVFAGDKYVIPERLAHWEGKSDGVTRHIVALPYLPEPPTRINIEFLDHDGAERAKAHRANDPAEAALVK
ncbi:MAG: cupin domain-containing protein [Ilumatobacteraceae bacterium]